MTVAVVLVVPSGMKKKRLFAVTCRPLSVADSHCIKAAAWQGVLYSLYAAAALTPRRRGRRLGRRYAMTTWQGWVSNEFEPGHFKAAKNRMMETRREMGSLDILQGLFFSGMWARHSVRFHEKTFKIFCFYSSWYFCHVTVCQELLHIKFYILQVWIQFEFEDC